LYTENVKRYLLIIVVLLLAGAGLWAVAYNPEMPAFSLAQYIPAISTPALPSVKHTVQDFDQNLAEVIRDTAKNGVTLPELSSWSGLNQMAQSTISAQISTSPDELWQTFRQEGSQAVISGMAQNAEISVNNISTEVMNEARYQYCRGVVEEYERQSHP
jgi:hypothetical protein